MRTINDAARMTVAVLATAGLLVPAARAQAPSSGADPANAISEAVQQGANPYRPPGGAEADSEQARRDRCAELERQFNVAPRQRRYTSPGTATETAQGRPIPKIERDQSRKTLQESYKANCL